MRDISQSKLKKLLSYDKNTGIFTWKVQPWKGRVRVGDIAGTARPDGYVIIRISQARYRAHRLAFLYMTGRMPSFEVDHIDGNPNNNSWANLREARPFENQQNRKTRSDNKSGFTGVSAYKGGKWQAHIVHRRKAHYLGIFDTPEEAGRAYAEAKRNLHTFSPEVRT